MMDKKDIIVNIFYKFKNGEIWNKITLDVQDYFDMKYLEEDEDIEIDTIPIYDKVIDYIQIENKKEISIIKLMITNIKSKASKLINVSYWNNQSNNITERMDKDSANNIVFHEIILTSLVNDELDKEIWEIIRFSRENEVITPKLHTFITENKDGLISERIIVPESI